VDAFEDSRLEDPEVLRAADPVLRNLAEAGSRVRREALQAAEALAGVNSADPIRAMITFGPEARLMRAVLEPTCPVPLVAWPRLGLPGWVGPLDVVVVLGGDGGEGPGGAELRTGASEAVRRGCRLVVAAPTGSVLDQVSASRSTTLLPTSTGDPLAAAIVTLTALHRLGLGPEVDPEAAADAMDLVAEASAARLDVSQNRAKAIALELADADPLVWGGSILAARASRRVAEALRAATGRVVLSADAGALEPLLTQVSPRDPFADPFEDLPATRRPGLVLLDDGRDDDQATVERRRLRYFAESREVMVSELVHDSGDVLERYVTVLQKGLFAAAYLQVGLGRN
jgi:hypothetical protein